MQPCGFGNRKSTNVSWESFRTKLLITSSSSGGSRSSGAQPRWIGNLPSPQELASHAGQGRVSELCFSQGIQLGPASKREFNRLDPLNLPESPSTF